MPARPNPPIRTTTTVKAVRNGPLQVKGELSLLDPTGQEYDLSDQYLVLLCRCGHSKNKPFCDGSHTRTGFSTQDQPTRKDT